MKKKIITFLTGQQYVAVSFPDGKTVEHRFKTVPATNDLITLFNYDYRVKQVVHCLTPNFKETVLLLEYYKP